jgi:Tfp pilus assembly protein PilO
MAKLTQKQQILAIGGGALTVGLLAAGGVYYAYGLIEEVETSIEQKTQAIAAAEGKIALIPSLEKEVIILRENLDEYVKILPDSTDLNDFLRIINTFERQSGVVGTGLTSLTKGGAGAKKTAERFSQIEYSYDMKATLWQFMKFINAIENYDRFISITGFTITSGGKDKNEELRDGDVVHTIKLTMQTYKYNGKAAGQDVEVPDYEDKRADLREEIFNRMQAIRIDKYEHRNSNGRRDIFVDPRQRGDLKIDGPSLPEQLAVLERNVNRVKELEDMLKRMRKPDTTLFEQYALEKSLRDGLIKLGADLDADVGRISYAPYRLRWAKDVVGLYDTLRGQVDQVGKTDPKRVDPYLPMKEMEQLVAEMRQELEAGNLQEAKNRYDMLEGRIAVPADDPRHELAVTAKALQVKAATAIDFSRMDLRIQGLVVNHGGRSGVLLNGEVFEEGDYISEELLVKLVEEEQVWFVFRGLTLVRTM